MLEKNVADGIHRVEDRYVNWYLVDDGGRLTAIDSGMPASWDLLRSAVTALGRKLSDVEAVILTHGHVDHVGFAERARTELGVQVWLHEGDRELAKRPLLGMKTERPIALYAWRPPTLGLLRDLALSGGLRPKGLTEARAFAGEGPLDVPGSPHAIFTPGHTTGHVSFHLPDRGVLVVGDAIVTRDPYTGATGPRLTARAANIDTERALESLGPLAATGARTVLPGHGEPWTGGVEAAVEQARAAGVA